MARRAAVRWVLGTSALLAVLVPAEGTGFETAAVDGRVQVSARFGRYDLGNKKSRVRGVRMKGKEERQGGNNVVLKAKREFNAHDAKFGFIHWTPAGRDGNAPVGFVSVGVNIVGETNTFYSANFDFGNPGAGLAFAADHVAGTQPSSVAAMTGLQPGNQHTAYLGIATEVIPTMEGAELKIDAEAGGVNDVPVVIFTWIIPFIEGQKLNVNASATGLQKGAQTWVVYPRLQDGDPAPGATPREMAEHDGIRAVSDLNLTRKHLSFCPPGAETLARGSLLSARNRAVFTHQYVQSLLGVLKKPPERTADRKLRKGVAKIDQAIGKLDKGKSLKSVGKRVDSALKNIEKGVTALFEIE